MILSKNPAAAHVPPGGAGQQSREELGRQSDRGLWAGAEEDEDGGGKRVGTVALAGPLPGQGAGYQQQGPPTDHLPGAGHSVPVTPEEAGITSPFACGMPGSEQLSDLYMGWKAVKRRFRLCLPDSDAQMFTMQRVYPESSWSENCLASHRQG